jgi:hypothetical protein
MRFHEFCPFFNENKVAEIKIREDSLWVDKLHLIEANKNFSCEDKIYAFDAALMTDKVSYHRIDAAAMFRRPEPNQVYFDLERCRDRLFDSWYWELCSRNSGWYNEAVQRNHCEAFKDDIADDDIVILSDLDEIIDSRHADRLISAVKKHQVVTVKLHYTIGYLNVFAQSNHGAPDFSYRVYVMSGRYFRTMPFTADYLRKKGIAECLYGEVHCLEDICGFHHSWLQHKDKAFEKMKAFAANIRDKTMVREDYISGCIRDRNLHYLNAGLAVDNGKTFLRALGEVDTSGLWYNELT